ncbi:TPA: NAD-dependent dehydratase [Candidatus Dependentiae bacterium]|nr:MAG: UDP-glucuronic acid decarboxylase 1 (UDP-glucuronatedecarboxylase 1) [candidate division TM6 bacterium GW2011_GWE2_31_21]KKP53900.1 MAG: UDP-glucuronic acid decarboxylase 1 (UDP-glucuronatedecarboxylase 1) [candidate division TM6 bacterium GW2011_GWF2_33_332]HBS47680.1 NAD-dependent dehydratase [Candidatus Dependentiae bacterium]HBZ73829.1 NAD-dependent dehydratase [Candidatus Dependentiae bacterium]
MENRILVTGGAGFLGSNLVRSLVEDKNNFVIVLDNLSSGRMQNIEDLLNLPNFKFIKHDIIFPIDLAVEQIYNLACPASPPRYQADPIQTTKTSILGAINMLDLANKNNAKILQTSTSEIYGDPLVHPQVESYRGNVNSIGIRACYDEGKRCAESLFFDYNRTYGVDIKVVRIFNTYGPAMDPQDGRVVSNFIMNALQNKPLEVYGEGSQTRSFCYVDDMIDGLIAMMNTQKNFYGPVNLGNPDEFTVLQAAELIIKLTQSRSKIIFKELPQDDPLKRNPDISLAKGKLSWEPQINFEEGLKKTILYFKKLI